MATADSHRRRFGPVRRSISRIGAWPSEKKALAASLAIMAALCAYRFYDLWTTGFIVSDEYGYIYYALHPTPGNAAYGDRLFFSSVNIALFRALGIGNSTSFALFLPFYLFFWDSLTMVAFYKMMKTLEFRGGVVAISLLSSLFIVTFDLLSLGFLSEPVGLAMAALGMYFVVKFVKAQRKWPTLLIYPALASLSFTAAAYTREPYTIFILAGFLPFLFAAANHWRSRLGRRIQLGVPNRKLLAIVLILGVVSFQGTSAYVQQQSGVSLLAQVQGVTGGLAQTLSHPLAEIAAPQASSTVTAAGSGEPAQATQPPAIACPAFWTSTSIPTAETANATQITTTTTATTTTATSSVVSSTTTSAETTISNAVATATTTTTSPASTTTTVASATTSATGASSSSVSSTSTATASTTTTEAVVGTPTITTTSNQTRIQIVVSPRITDTIMIFLAGLLLGWGPVITLITILGCLALLVSAARRRSLELVTMLSLAVLALGSYLGVAFVFSNQPSYLTFQHFSTLIRFSDTAIPAYFIVAPVAFDLILKKRKYVALVIVGLLLTLAVVPAYQGYAASNLNLPQNPFSLNYRTPGVIVRDYITGLNNDSSLDIEGLSYQSWWWTPGSAWIGNLTFSSYLTYQQLVSAGWSTFYVLGDNSSNGMYCELHAVLPYGVALGQYRVLSEQTVTSQDGYSLMKVELSWQPT